MRKIQFTVRFSAKLGGGIGWGDFPDDWISLATANFIAQSNYEASAEVTSVAVVSECADEVWRSIAGYEGDYEVSNMGRVRALTMRNRNAHKRLETPTIMKATKVGAYYRVQLCRRGKRRHITLQTLVLSAFVGGRPHGMAARHLNGDPSDNRLENLAWGTYAENEADKRRHGTAVRGEDSVGAKLKNNDVVEILRRCSAGERKVDLAKEFGVSVGNIYRINKGQAWRHISSQMKEDGE